MAMAQGEVGCRQLRGIQPRVAGPAAELRRLWHETAAGSDPGRSLCGLVHAEGTGSRRPEEPGGIRGRPGAAGRDRAVAPGRNDPCWCGSGKKYKRCCATAAPAPLNDETEL
ncbi:MAG: SEC-C metal-binding domain-containing protein [Bacillota bacterium]